MNHNKRLLLVLFILALSIPFCFITVFAEGESLAAPGSSTVSNIGQDSQQPARFPLSEIPTPPPQSTTGVPSSVAPPSSSTPPSSSAPPRSKKPVKKVIGKAVSSAVSSETSSDESSEVSSEDSSAAISLPSVGGVLDSANTSSVVDKSGINKTSWIGIIAWAFIILGVIVILIVLLSNRRSPRGPGRKRYRSPKHSNKKHLLVDKYYRNINH